MNALFETDYLGKLGELIAQVHLLAHGVQAAPPVKDSGNDLIAVREHLIFAVQVKASSDGSIDKPNPKRLYHILAVVRLPFDHDLPLVDQARVYLFRKEDVAGLKGTVDDYPKALISDKLILKLWPNTAPRFIKKGDEGSALDR